jgi:hypothetical protein
MGLLQLTARRAAKALAEHAFWASLDQGYYPEPIICLFCQKTEGLDLFSSVNPGHLR